MRYIILSLFLSCPVHAITSVMFSGAKVTSCSNGLTTNSDGRVNGCGSGGGAASSLAITAGSTSTISVAAIVPFEIMIASGDSFGVIGATITAGTDAIFYSSYTYQMFYFVQAGVNPVNVGLVFNGDWNGNYIYASNSCYSAVACALDGSVTGQCIDLFPTKGGTRLVAGQTSGTGSFYFGQEYGNMRTTNGVVDVWSGSSESEAAVNLIWGFSTFFGRWTNSGSGAITSIAFGTDTGNTCTAVQRNNGSMNIHWEVWQVSQHK